MGGVPRERAIRAISGAGAGQQGSPPRGVTYPLHAARDPRGEGEPTRSRLADVKVARGYVQGDNAQAAVNENQIVIAAEVTVDPPDSAIWSRWSTPPAGNCRRLASQRRRGCCSPTPAAYWNKEQMENVISHGIQVLIPPDAGHRKGTVRDGTDRPTRISDDVLPPSSDTRSTENARR